MKPRTGIVGVGAIGGFVAAELAAAGIEPVLVARRDRDEALTAERLDGRRIQEGPPRRVSSTYEALEDVDVCLVTVKSSATPVVARALASALRQDATVLSLQNGLSNAATLEASLGKRVAAGVVGYNVFVDEAGTRVQSTRGGLYFGALEGVHAGRLRALASALRAAGDRVEIRRDIDAVAHGKLLMNLNNGVCAATGLGIRASLEDADARWAFAQCIREGLQVLRALGRPVARLTVVPPNLFASALLLPSPLVVPLATRVAGVRAGARSSTLVDLEHGSATEIDELNGAIVRLSRDARLAAPANGAVTTVVHAHEDEATRGQRPAYVAPAELRQRIEASG